MRRTCIGIPTLSVIIGCSLALMGTVGCSRSNDDSAEHSPSQASARGSNGTDEGASPIEQNAGHASEGPKTSFGKALHSAEGLRDRAAGRNDELAEQATALDEEGGDTKNDELGGDLE